MADLSDRSDDDLLAGVAKLVVSHRRLTVELVAHLGEIEERQLHLVAGFSSMFDFCQKKLGMSEGEAFRRIVAARLGRRFPVVHRLLASGGVNLSTLELVREWLTEENHEALLAAVARKSKREVQAVVAARFPRPDCPSRIRRHATLEPLSESRLRVEFTASAALCEKLELCRDLMSHANPSRELGVVIERAADLLLAKLERERLGKAKNPRRKPNEEPVPSERIATAARRKVYERDGLRCTYVSEDGRRCEARAFLELDHAEPKAVGGTSATENLRVRCRAHNQLWAEQVFGREFVEQKRHFRQQKCSPAQSRSGVKGEAAFLESRPPQCVEKRASDLPTSVFEKARLALRGMGFRDEQARHAVASVNAQHAGELPALESVLREALLAATSRAA